MANRHQQLQQQQQQSPKPQQTNNDDPPNYIELDFGNNNHSNRSNNSINSNNNSNNDDNLVGTKQQQQQPQQQQNQPKISIISPQSRISRYEQQKQQIDKYFTHTSCDNNHHQYSNQSEPQIIFQQKQQQQQRQSNEDPRDFATFLCIFACVMTTVLVLMFYMVGEAAFRLILMVISFVSILTLCLACFLRRPTLVILGQTNFIPNTSVNNNNNNKPPQPYLMIFPTLFGRPFSIETAETSTSSSSTIVKKI